MRKVVRRYFPYYMKCCREVVFLEDDTGVNYTAWSRIDMALAHHFGMWIYRVKLGDVSAAENIEKCTQRFDFEKRGLKKKNFALANPTDGQSKPEARAHVR